ncbi:MAG: hypothetical protein KF773_01750 [Deltaproteobacteria bacterium]|nr:hypothetical protein [Deltaproteobacteria bacterium]
MSTTKKSLLWSLFVVVGCQGTNDPPAEPEAPSPPSLSDASFTHAYAGPATDLTVGVESEQLAFAQQGGAFRGRYLTHDVSVRDGVVGLTPSHLDDSGKTVVGGSIELETTALRIGDSPIAVTFDAVVQSAPNVLHIPRGSFTEVITNREDGIEQSWKFGVQPLVPGDLDIEVAVRDQTFVAATDSGLHFQSPQGLGIRYSHAVWRDSAGSEWVIPSRFEADRIRITVPEDIIADSVYPAVLDPTITGELFTDNPVNGTTGRNSRNQAMASDGTRYFIVWQDERDSAQDIFATRVNANGSVVDPIGIRVNQAAGAKQNPTAAFVGNGFVVAWERTIATGNSDIEAAFVSTAGAVTQLGAIASTAADETRPALASNGTQALLVWQSGTDLRGAVFAGGAFGASFAVAASANIEKEPTVAATASNYLVAFTETVGTNDNVRGQIVTSAGGLTGSAFNIAAAPVAEGQPSAAFDGTNYVVAFSVVHSGTSNDLQVARVSPAGALVDATPVDVSLVGGAQILPKLACNGATCFLVWEDTRNLATSLRDILGAVLTTEPAISVTANDIAVSVFARQQTAPAVAFAGTQFLATWNDTRDLDTTSVRGSRISTAGAVVDTATPLTLVTSVANYQAPTVGQTTGFTDYVFAASQVPDVNLVHIRFDGSGIQQDTTPRIVSNAAGAQLAPAAAGLGADALVVWQDSRGVDRDIYAARINMSTGNSRDGNGVAVTTAAGEQVVPKVATDGTSSGLVVWQDRRTGAFDIYGAIINASGTVVATDIPICTAAGDQTRPNVAFDTVNKVYLVVWTDPNGDALDIRGARVSPAGVLLDANCGTAISSSPGSQFSAALTYGSNQFFVVWEDRRNDANLGDIYGTRVTTNGAINVLDPNGIAISTFVGSSESEPTVAFAGYGAGAYIVAWTDNRNAATTGRDILGAQVSTTGVVAAQFPIANTAESERSPQIAAGTTAAKPLTITYTRQNSAINSARIQVRRITTGTVQGQACTQDSQCESGFCRDYKCCNSDCGGGGANGNTGDCQACSIAHRGSVDGTCTTIAASENYVCRLYASSICDVSERCTGTSTACPADIGQRQGVVCNTTTGAVCPPNAAPGPHVCP